MISSMGKFDDRRRRRYDMHSHTRLCSRRSYDIAHQIRHIISYNISICLHFVHLKRFMKERKTTNKRLAVVGPNTWPYERPMPEIVHEIPIFCVCVCACVRVFVGDIIKRNECA